MGSKMTEWKIAAKPDSLSSTLRTTRWRGELQRAVSDLSICTVACKHILKYKRNKKAKTFLFLNST